MEYWSQSTILGKTESRHLASEPHMRIQIMRIAQSTDIDLFDEYHGELLIIVWSGDAVLTTVKGTQSLKPGDQCFLANGEAFKIESAKSDASIIVQMIWSPGTSKCDKC